MLLRVTKNVGFNKGQLLVWLGGKFMAIARFCLEKLLAENVSFNFPAAVLLVLATTILIGSGCWAASIALSRRHSGWLHFLLGALMPGIYPLVIMFAMGLKGERKRKKQRAAERRAREKEEEEKRLVMEIQGIQPQEEPSRRMKENSMHSTSSALHGMPQATRRDPGR